MRNRCRERKGRRRGFQRPTASLFSLESKRDRGEGTYLDERTDGGALGLDDDANDVQSEHVGRSLPDPLDVRIVNQATNLVLDHVSCEKESAESAFATTELERWTHPCPPSASMQCGISLVERSALNAFATGVNSRRRSCSLVVSSSSLSVSALPCASTNRLN